MAITKMLNIKAGKYGNYEHLRNAIPYATNPDKTSQGYFTGACNCLPETAFQQMIFTKEKFDKCDQRVAYHFIISFPKHEVTPSVAYQVVDEFVQRYLSERYEAVFGIHEDKEHIHGHIVFNSVSFVDGRKYHYKAGDWRKQIQPIVNRLCEERGLLTVDLEKQGKRRKHYGEWKAEKDGKPTILSFMKNDVDECIRQAKSYGEFIRLLGACGYQVRVGKHISLCIKGEQGRKPRRIDTCFGVEYTVDRIKERIEREVPLEKKQDFVSPKIKSVEPFHYHRAKLTPYQKRYYCKLYRTGQLKRRRSPERWKYRDDILRLQELQEQFCYLWRHQFQSIHDLEKREQELMQTYASLEIKREAIYQKRREYRKLFELLKHYLSCKGRAECYLAGEDVFQKDYEKMLELKSALQKAGVTVEMVQRIRRETKEELLEIAKERRVIRQELSLLDKTKRENLDSIPGRLEKKREIGKEQRRG